MEEIVWIRKARDGDTAAFARLVDAYQTHVYNLTYRMLGERMAAEDAAQEAFLRAFQNLHRYDPNRSFRTWLLSIAAHHAIDRIRRRRPQVPLEKMPPRAIDDPGPERQVVQRERSEAIQQLLDRLSPTDRAAVTLLYWYDHSYEEIAETLDLTVSAVKSRLYRARRTMAQAMEEGIDVL
jgi:RNA polymerase sigma-70 factor (ECF subfamily)